MDSSDIKGNIYEDTNRFNCKLPMSNMLHRVISFSAIDLLYKVPGKGRSSGAKEVSLQEQRIAVREMAPEGITAPRAKPAFIPLNDSSFLFGYVIDFGSEEPEQVDEKLIEKLDGEAKLKLGELGEDFEFNKISEGSMIPPLVSGSRETSCTSKTEYLTRTYHPRTSNTEVRLVNDLNRISEQNVRSEKVKKSSLVSDVCQLFSMQSQDSPRDFGNDNREMSELKNHPLISNVKSLLYPLKEKDNNEAFGKTLNNFLNVVKGKEDTVYVAAYGSVGRQKGTGENRAPSVDGAVLAGSRKVKINNKLNGVLNFYLDRDLEKKTAHWICKKN